MFGPSSPLLAARACAPSSGGTCHCAGCRTDWLCRAGTIPPDASRPLAFGRRVPQALTASHLWVRRLVGKAWALPPPRLLPSASRLGCQRSRNGAQYSTVRRPSPRRALLPDLPITLYNPNQLFSSMILLLFESDTRTPRRGDPRAPFILSSRRLAQAAAAPSWPAAGWAGQLLPWLTGGRGHVARPHAHEGHHPRKDSLGSR